MDTEESVDALIVIDLQEDYFDDPGLARQRDVIVRRVSGLASRAHAAGRPVIEVRTVHAADQSTWTLDMLDDESGVVIEGTPGAQPIAGLELGASAVVVKTRDSGFFRTDLRERLAGVRRPALVGVSTESCVLATAMDAYAHDLRVVLVEDAIASSDPELHRTTLERLHEQYRQPVVAAAAVTFGRDRVRS